MAAGLSLTWDCKRWFFDRPKVLALIGEAKVQRLGASGALVRTIAQRSMRYVSKVYARENKSPAGQPPRAIREHPWLRKWIEFAFDPSTKTEVVGPILLPGKLGINVPRLHEFGGRIFIRNTRRRRYKVGMAGPIRITGIKYSDAPAGGSVDEQYFDATAVYTRLRTAAQAARANRLNRQLYGPAKRYPAVYPARPYMGGPTGALAKARPYLEKIWAKSIVDKGKVA